MTSPAAGFDYSQLDPHSYPVKVNCCPARFGGLKTTHCTSCHENFTSYSGFDRHRRAGHCLVPATVLDSNKFPVFQSAGRAYPCWSLTGGLVDLEGE